MSEARDVEVSTWDQIIPRTYARLMLIFNLGDHCTDSTANIQAVSHHLQASLKTLASRKPIYTSRLFLSPDGKTVFRTENHQEGILFQEMNKSGMAETQAREPKRFPHFSDIQKKGYPQEAFFKPIFDDDGQPKRGRTAIVGNRVCENESASVPVCKVKAIFIPGNGLLLVIFYHHCFGGGDAMGKFIKDFAACSRGDDPHLDYVVSMPPDIVQAAHEIERATNWKNLLTRCPEYTHLGDIDTDTYDESSVPNEILEKWPEPYGPTQPDKRYPLITSGTINADEAAVTNKNENICRILQFKRKGPDSIDQLKREIASYSEGIRNYTSRPLPTTNTVIAALIWFHSVRARIMAGEQIPNYQAHNLRKPNPGESHFYMPVDWKNRYWPSYDTAATSTTSHCASLSSSVSKIPPERKNFASASVALSTVSIPVDNILSTAVTSAISPLSTSISNLAQYIVPAVERTRDQVTLEYVATRAALIQSIPDVRSVVITYNPEDPVDFYFNSWINFGADSIWWFGDCTYNNDEISKPENEYHAKKKRLRYADCLRRADAGTGKGSAVVLPSKQIDSVIETIISLPKAAMEVLLKDQGLLRYVDRVI